MATAQMKAPPVFDDDEDYSSWRNDVEIWQMFTELPAKKQGPAVYLSLKGRAREAVRDLSPIEIGDDDGLKTIMTKLDSIFLKEKNTRAFLAFKEFYDYKRNSGDDFADFIIQFEKFYNKIKKFDMNLPDAVQAYFLLNAANVSDENEKLARTTCGELTYKNMKDTLMKVFGEFGGASVDSSNNALPIKQECMYGSGRRNVDNNGKGKFGKTISGTNYTGKDGKPLRCYECDSIKHLANRCPHRNVAKQSNNNQTSSEESWKKKTNDNSNTGTEHVHITLFAAIPDRKQYCLIGESFGRGILDSGCTKTVSGETWMEEYLPTLSIEDKKLVIERKSDSIYRFGDGIEVKADRNMIIPVTIGKKKYRLAVDIVKNAIPLLISRNTMKSLGMRLDFSIDFNSI